MGEVLILVNPFSVAFEEDLQGRCSSTTQFNGSALDYVGVFWLLNEVRQGALR